MENLELKYAVANYICEQYDLNKDAILKMIDMYINGIISEDEAFTVLGWVPEDARVKLIKEYMA